MGKKCLLLTGLILFMTLTPLFVKAQQDTLPPNQVHHSIYVELLGLGIFGSLNYELQTSFLNIRFGITGGPVVSLTYPWRFAANHYFEVGGGACLFITGGGVALFPSPIIGYMYHPFDGGFLFKVQSQYTFKSTFEGLSPRGFWVGLSFGHCW